MCSESLKTTFKRFCIVVIFSIAFAYIESAVVVYLRTIFHPEGFTFPLKTFGLTALWKQHLLTEVGREIATIVVIATAASLFGRNRQEQSAYFLIIFAVWDIFYYVWLKVLIDWPASIMDWDILFLIPVVWASPVLCPLLISIAMLIFAVIVLHRNRLGRPLKVVSIHWIGWLVSVALLTLSFCIAATHITRADYQSYFHWPLFALGYALAVATSLKCLAR